MSRVLIVEDEAHLAEGLRFNLEAEGHAVELAADGESALKRLIEGKERFDAVVLDVMLPGKSGFDVALALRQKQNYVPILMLTARGRPEDVLQGFASGADDYLPKPFELAILIARLDSLLRRSAWMKTPGASLAGPSFEAPLEALFGPSSESGAAFPAANRDGRELPEAQAAKLAAHNGRDIFNFCGKSIDFAELELRSLGNTIHLTVMEAEFLRYLVQSAGRIVSRKAILEDVWGLHEDTDTRAIDNFVVRLRRYIEDDPSRPRHLQTVRGVGYRFIAEPA
jgi:DNA-binding response OmpR family regulator